MPAHANRRQFLATAGMGFGALAAGTLLKRDGILRAGETGMPQRAFPAVPQAKSVIWIFLIGGMSQMESFDPKPELNKYAGQTIEESPYKATLHSPYGNNNL